MGRLLELIEDSTDHRLAYTKVAALVGQGVMTWAFVWQVWARGLSVELLLAYGGLMTGLGFGSKWLHLRSEGRASPPARWLSRRRRRPRRLQ